VLSILADTIATDHEINLLIARSIVARGLQNVGVLGLSYKANLKVSILSPTISFVNELIGHGISVKLYDPFFDAKEVNELVGVPIFDFPAGLSEFDSVVAIVDHDVCREAGHKLLEYLGNCRFILDNMGMWSGLAEEFAALGIDYHICGDANWLG
jgi:UDP-N-acetyl-D-mannosaminuronate dehydrogenase